MAEQSPYHLDDETRTELARAFASVRPELAAMTRDHARLDPDALVEQFDGNTLDQFLNAYDAVFQEALQGTGRQTRELVLDSAVEPILAMGQTPLGLIRSNVIWAILLSDRLLACVRADMRHPAAMWLAYFLSEYAYDLGERALAVERKRR